MVLELKQLRRERFLPTKYLTFCYTGFTTDAHVSPHPPQGSHPHPQASVSNLQDVSWQPKGVLWVAVAV